MKGLAFKEDGHQVAPDAMFKWPGGQGRAVVYYFIHNPLAWGQDEAAAEMIHLFR